MHNLYHKLIKLNYLPNLSDFIFFPHPLLKNTVNKRILKCVFFVLGAGTAGNMSCDACLGPLPGQIQMADGARERFQFAPRNVLEYDF